jgi:hypothetical protein
MLVFFTSFVTIAPLQEKPSALKREHPVLKSIKILDFFFYFCVSFLPSWIRFRICNLNADPDPDPATQINADLFGSRFETLVKKVKHVSLLSGALMQQSH